jgi:hypothetical protein
LALPCRVPHVCPPKSLATYKKVCVDIHAGVLAYLSAQAIKKWLVKQIGELRFCSLIESL